MPWAFGGGDLSPMLAIGSHSVKPRPRGSIPPDLSVN